MVRQLGIDIEKTPALEAIWGEREWWDSLEWQNDGTKSHFQNKFVTISETSLAERKAKSSLPSLNLFFYLPSFIYLFIYLFLHLAVVCYMLKTATVVQSA